MILPDQEPAAYLRLAEEQLRELHLQGAGGQELARRRADLLDLVLISLFRQAEHESATSGSFREMGLAVVALGGYGRRELCPFSDVDLMLLYRPEDAEAVAGMAERLFYPLWDAGLDLGHGARTVEECRALARESFEIETSLLQARLLVGDRLLFTDLLERVREQTSEERSRVFVEHLAEGRTRRHRAHGPAHALLEPHLKEGRGALRDVHEVLWLAGALHGVGGLEGLVSLGWLTPDLALELGGAVDRLLRARSALHYAVGRKVDRLYLDYQPDVAALWGAPAESVMREVWGAAEAVSTITREVWAAAVPERGRSVAVSWPAEVPEGPRHTLHRLLREGHDGIAAMEWLSHRGLLSDWIPGWEEIRHLGQFDNLHTYTVGGHSLRCAAAVVGLAEAGASAGDGGSAGTGESVEPGGVDSLGARLASVHHGGPLWDTLLLACLLHDIGKGTEAPDHSEAGAMLAARAAAALGEPRDVQEMVRFLVSNHLLLVGTAVRRDLEDAALVERLAGIVGTRDRLELLYVLTVADSTATGTAVWTPWTAALARELFFRVLHVLEDGRGTGMASQDSVVESPATSPGASRPAVDERGGAPVLSLTIPLGHGDQEATLDVRPSALPGVEELVVVSPPHTGVLARVSGVLACHGITIMSAQVQPDEAGTVSRVFHVADQFEGAVPEERWMLVRRDLARAFAGRLSLDYRLAERRARYAPPSGCDRHEPARVVVENGVSQAFTVIEVHAADRIGLLYTLARTLDDLQLEVDVAKVATQRERVVDVFYVTDARGAKLMEPDHLLEVERALLFALERGA